MAVVVEAVNYRIFVSYKGDCCGGAISKTSINLLVFTGFLRVVVENCQ